MDLPTNRPAVILPVVFACVGEPVTCLIVNTFAVDVFLLFHVITMVPMVPFDFGSGLASVAQFAPVLLFGDVNFVFPEVTPPPVHLPTVPTALSVPLTFAVLVRSGSGGLKVAVPAAVLHDGVAAAAPACWLTMTPAGTSSAAAANNPTNLRIQRPPQARRFARFPIRRHATPQAQYACVTLRGVVVTHRDDAPAA